MNKNSQTYFGSLHNLKVYRPGDITRFVVWESAVILRSAVFPEKFNLAPGTLALKSDRDDSGIYTHTLEFKLAYPAADINRRGLYAGGEQVVATFTDSRGQVRVIGTRECPALLTWGEDNGMTTGEITARAPWLLPRLAD